MIFDPEKCRNFSRAAVSRNVSQPAFSRRIRALEQAIGVELFNRRNAAATLRTRENLPFADPPSVATVREQSGRAAWRQRLRAT